MIVIGILDDVLGVVGKRLIWCNNKVKFVCEFCFVYFIEVLLY